VTRRREALVFGLAILLMETIGAIAPAPPPARASVPIPAKEYRMPVIEVRGELLTIDEVIARAAQVEQGDRSCEVPRRFTSHVRFVAVFGDTTAPGCKREVLEQVSRVEEGPGPAAARSICIWENSEVWRGDSLAESKLKEIDRRRFGRQIEQIRQISFTLERGLYHYAIIDRRKLPDQTLIHVSYLPRQDFAPRPEGEAWLDTRHFVVLRQTGRWTRNVPLPFLIRAIDGFSVRRSRYGPIWLEDEMWMRISFRHGLGGPDRIEFSISLSDVTVGSGPQVAPVDSSGDLIARGIVDSLSRADRSAADPFLWRPSRIEIARAVTRGDSLLGAPRGEPPVRAYGWTPLLRYDRAQRVLIGAGVRLGRGREYRSALALEGGYASGLRHRAGRAELAVEIGSAPGLRAGAEIRAADEVAHFGADPPFYQLFETAAFGDDPLNWFDRREASAAVWIGRGLIRRIGPYGRMTRDRPLRPQSLWSVFRGQVESEAPFRQIDPGETRLLGIEIRMRDERHAPWLELTANAETGRTEGGAGFVGTHDLRCTFVARPILPGGRRLVLRGEGMAADPRFPRQERLYFGENGTLRGYDEGTLVGRSGYHVGGEFFLNRDIVGWLPWIPDRGFGLEAFLAGDYGRILSDREALNGEVSGARASAGIGLAWTVGIPMIPRFLVGIHRGLRREDHAWIVRLGIEAAEGAEGEKDP